MRFQGQFPLKSVLVRSRIFSQSDQGYFARRHRVFTDSQIIAIIKHAEAGSPVPELCREHVTLPLMFAAVPSSAPGSGTRSVPVTGS
ncbi:MAG: hypothetical protein CVV19_01060 [Gammaproteobacteria bacterium HGW-Gammaproteobacteria-9]|nr:MAG: hypothetical protein CVV19_01060 [Gammaproteobacteria bacterium HGW-Gammaproteobacteria-9]